MYIRAPLGWEVSGRFRKSVGRHQKKGSFGRDQLKPLLGNISLALESCSTLCNIFPGPELGSTEVGGRPTWYFNNRVYSSQDAWSYHTDKGMGWFKLLISQVEAALGLDLTQPNI